HDLWRGRHDRYGVPILKIRGTTASVRRLVWEAAHGALSKTTRVEACPDQPACVRLEHLRVDGSDGDTAARRSLRRAPAVLDRNGRYGPACGSSPWPLVAVRTVEPDVHRAPFAEMPATPPRHWLPSSSKSVMVGRFRRHQRGRPPSMS